MNINEMIKECRALTQVNAHGEAYLLAARGLGLTDLAERFARINRRHEELG